MSSPSRDPVFMSSVGDFATGTGSLVDTHPAPIPLVAMLRLMSTTWLDDPQSRRLRRSSVPVLVGGETYWIVNSSRCGTCQSEHREAVEDAVLAGLSFGRAARLQSGPHCDGQDDNVQHRSSHPPQTAGWSRLVSLPYRMIGEVGDRRHHHGLGPHGDVAPSMATTPVAITASVTAVLGRRSRGRQGLGHHVLERHGVGTRGSWSWAWPGLRSARRRRVPWH